MKFNGKSGAKIILLNNNVVRKISSHRNMNNRLILQCEKQKKFTPYKNILTPKIFSTGYTEDKLFYFDMEFIDGISFYKLDNKNKLIKFKEIIDFIKNNLKNSSFLHINHLTIMEKLNELETKLVFDKDLIDILNKLKTIISGKNFSIPNGYFHGDLTFENIIFKNEKIFFIDFLDNIIDSPINDIIKIRQNTRYNWVNKKKITQYDEIIYDTFREYIDNNQTYTFFNILNIIRLLPYIINDKKHFNFIKEIIIKEHDKTINSCMW